MDSDTSAPHILDRGAIKKLIPHRDPFLFLDRIIEAGPKDLIAEWDVTASAPFFAGHYPGNPIVPGVILNEFVFQAAAVFMSLKKDEDPALEGVPVLTRIEDARFKQIVRPGETVRAEITLTARLGPACFMTGRVVSGGKNVLRLAFVVAMTQPEEDA